MTTKRINTWSKKLTNRSLPSLFEDNPIKLNQLNQTCKSNQAITIHNKTKTSVENILNKFNIKSINILLHKALSKKNLTENEENELVPENNCISFRNKIIFEDEKISDFQGRFYMTTVGGIQHSKTEFYKVSDNKNLEKYQSEQFDMIDSDGKELSEKKETYKNSLSGTQENFYSKKYDNKKFKKLKKISTFTGENETHDILENIKEDEVEKFTKTLYNNKKYKEHRAYNSKNKYRQDGDEDCIISKLKVGKRKYHKKNNAKSSMRSIFSYSIPYV